MDTDRVSELQAELPWQEDAVHLTMPATAQNVGLARSLAAAIAARADLPIDTLEDLRLAVSEAVSGAVADAVPGSQVSCSFAETPDRLSVQVRYQSQGGRGPDTDGFSWAIMRALATELTCDVAGETVTVTLHIERSLPVQA